MTKSERKKRAWFELGVQAVSRVWPELSGRYVCPLCRREFPLSEIDQFIEKGCITFEHAPPESLSGHEVALTCKPCNDKAGELVDSQARNREGALDQYQGTMSKPERVRLKVAGYELNADLQIRGGAVIIRFLPDQNRPGLTDAAFSEVVRLIAEAGNPGKGMWTFVKGYQPKLARVGWLKSGYLVAFALLGYRYAFSPALQPVRDQLAAPKTETLNGYLLNTPHVAPDTRRILRLNRPRPFGSLIVQMGRQGVLLPWDDEDVTFYDRLEQQVGGQPLLEAAVTSEYQWPNRPMHERDF